MKLICPECKNQVDISRFPNLAKDQVVECNMCGISLIVTNTQENGDVETQIVEEGK